MAAISDGGKRTVVQKLPELVEWYLADKKVELRFAVAKQKNGRVSPDFHFHYYLGGRRISERGLAMQLMTDLARMNYSLSLQKINCAIASVAWQHYLATQDYPDWMRNREDYTIRRPVGRPRTKPRLISDPETPVNTRQKPGADQPPTRHETESE